MEWGNNRYQRRSKWIRSPSAVWVACGLLKMCSRKRLASQIIPNVLQKKCFCGCIQHFIRWIFFKDIHEKIFVVVVRTTKINIIPPLGWKESSKGSYKANMNNTVPNGNLTTLILQGISGHGSHMILHTYSDLSNKRIEIIILPQNMQMNVQH